jgi:hypothetical protein
MGVRRAKALLQRRAVETTARAALASEKKKKQKRSKDAVAKRIGSEV